MRLDSSFGVADDSEQPRLPALAEGRSWARSAPRESFDVVGFDAFSSDCGQATCTDTFLFAEQQTPASGETFEYVCGDQFTYNARTGRLVSSQFGCADANLTVADDLSSATLAPTEVELCGSSRA